MADDKVASVDVVFEYMRDGQTMVSLTRAQTDLLHMIETALSQENEDEELLSLQGQLSQSDAWEDVNDEVIKIYKDKRLELKLAITSFDMGVPRLVKVSSKVISTGPRRKQSAAVRMAFEDNSSLDLAMDLKSLERLAAAVKDAQTEVSRVAKDLKTRQE